MNKSTVLLPATFLILASCRNQQKKESEPSKPDIFFIYADDLGFNNLSCKGSNYYETPNIDRIYSEIMVFTNGYSNNHSFFCEKREIGQSREHGRYIFLMITAYGDYLKESEYELKKLGIDQENLV